MKNFLVAALKIFFYLILFIAAVAGAFWLVHWKGWPWWMALVLLAGLFGLILLLLFAKRWFFRRRERKFVKRVIDQDKERIDATGAAGARSAYELQERWREAIQVLKQSSLTRVGNPLYILPWYLVLGAPSSGKTTSIRSARLPSPITDVTPLEGITATRNCDWWFLDDAVLMDTAGRYATSVDQTLDREEWREFLTLLAKYRKKEPISGLVVAVSADSLLDEDTDALIRDARSIRRRADELMRSLGATFPVYVLVTKLDRLMGMKSFSALLNKGDLHQAMGWMNDVPKRAPEDSAELAVETVADHLKDLRLWLATHHPEADPALVLFPDEVANLKPGLVRFVNALFERNPFQETPFLRGVYFGSGRQEGDTLPHLPEVLKDFRMQPAKRLDTHKGLFLHDFFGKILPSDRRLYSPLFEFVRWRKLTHNLGMLAALAVICCFCGLITFSFIKNRQALDEFIGDFNTVPQLNNDLRRDLILLDNFREELFHMQVLNRDWLLPRLGLSQSLYAQDQIEDLYVDLFRKGLLDPLDGMLSQNVAALNDDSPEKQLTRYIAHIVGRINLVDAKLGGATPAQLQKQPMPDERVFSQVEANMIPEVAEYFDRLYLTYLDLAPNQIYLQRERGQLMSLLREVLRAKQTELYWLVDWANDSPQLTAINMQQFWGLTAQSPDDTAQVAPAYTAKGLQLIKAFIQRMESALDDGDDIAERVQDFKAWYAQQYANAWQTFATHFPDGENWERTYLEWKSLASTMSSDTNPYFDLMGVMSENLKSLTNVASQSQGQGSGQTKGSGQGSASSFFPAGQITLPPWLNTVFNFSEVQTLYNQRDVAEAESKLVRDLDTGKKLLQALSGGDAQNATKGGTQAPDDLQRRANVMDAVDAYDKYGKAQEAILPATTSGDAALNMAAGFFKAEPDPSKNTSPYNQAHVAITQMEHLISQPQSNDQFIWDIIAGPHRFLIDFTIIEAARAMQQQYEGIVLAAVSDAPKNKLANLLFDQKTGAAWKFANGPAAPFLGRNASGYFAKAAYGKRFPFDPSLFRFLEQGSAEVQVGGGEFQVTIKGYPTDTNKGSTQDPYATLLKVDCAPKPFTLENLNYPQEADITWKPDQCGDTTFTIKFDSFDLTKRYAGGYGFPKFLKDFQYGSRIFKPDDFPNEKASLELMQISEIIVSYSITGGAPVIQLLQRREIDVPQVIVEPWVF